jgi:hypothetical protein
MGDNSNELIHAAPSDDTQPGYNGFVPKASNSPHDALNDPDYSDTLAAIGEAFTRTPHARWHELAEHISTPIAGWQSVQSVPDAPPYHHPFFGVWRDNPLWQAAKEELAKQDSHSQQG